MYVVLVNMNTSTKSVKLLPPRPGVQVLGSYGKNAYLKKKRSSLFLARLAYKLGAE